MNNTENLAIELENFLLANNEWSNHINNLDLISKNILQAAQKEMIPTGLGYHEKYGYFILMAGQGPMIAYIENKID